MDKAYFAGGCFWCITPFFARAKGVAGVVSGFSGGEEKDPAYEQVKAQQTGHRESIEVSYDPQQTSFDTLLHIFLANVDPYDGGGQYIDRGHSYTLAVYYQNEKERLAAQKALDEIPGAQIALEPFCGFYAAGEEHQEFYKRHPEEFAKEMEESGRTKGLSEKGERLVRQLKSFVEEEPWYVSLLPNAAALIWETLPDLNWAGFYLIRDGVLALGPFEGKTACIHIPLGKGVCGTAAVKDSTLRVPDVHEFPGHIACDSASNSEIVIPLHKNGRVIGVMDLDSPSLNRFTAGDQTLLERFAGVLEENIDLGELSVE